MATEHYYTKAIWSSNTSPQSYPSLTEDITVDVAIVGGGITGLSAANLLAKAGKKVAVLEALQVGKGTTGSSTGNLYAPVGERLFTIESKHSADTMRAVALSRTAALEQIEDWINEYKIDCEFKRVPWYLFTTSETKDQDQQIGKEFDAATKAGLFVTNAAPSNFPYKNLSSITTVAHQAQYNPLKYAQGLAAATASGNCRIFENTKVTQVEDGSPCRVHTTGGKVTAEHVIMATHSPKGIYAVQTAMTPNREYAMAVKLRGSLPEGGIYWHVHQKQMYSVRPYSNEKGNFLIVLGQPHKVGHKEHSEESFKEVEEYARTHFDVESVEYTWAAQNYKPADNLPYIGTSILESNTYIATGFEADGLVYGTLAAIIISDSISGRKSQWADIYDPKRFTPIASGADLIKDNVDVAKHLLKDYLFYNNEDSLRSVKNGEGKTLKLNDEHVAVHRDEEGKLHIVSAICTHMGCVVHWNNGEKSWDCPCHGSRFSVDGKVLEGPAYNDLSKPGA